MKEKSKIDPKIILKRKGVDKDKQKEELVPPPVSSPIDRVIDLAFNPSREKIREVTVVDRVQGRLFPLLDVVNSGCLFCLEVASYRQSAEHYEKAFKKKQPIPPNFLDEFMFRTAQWQKSIAGKNLERAIDIALAETEAKAGEEELREGADFWKD